MKLFMSFFEFWIRDMSIYLCCCDGSMSEELLDDTYVSTICQQGRRKTVTEGMRV